MKSYVSLLNEIIDNGTDIYNERTGKSCRTILNVSLEYDLTEDVLPILTTKYVAWKPAIAELLGYLRGYSSAHQFRQLGTKTWDANANQSPGWLKNPNRKGTDDMGRVYGVQGRSWINKDGEKFDQLRDIYRKIKEGNDDRGLILTYWNPGEHHLGCLRPCVHTYQFSLLGDDLYLTVYQRSCDVPLGLPFNMIQIAVFLKLMAQITGKRPVKAVHNIVNAHIYNDQLELAKEQAQRAPKQRPRFAIDPRIKTLADVESIMTVGDVRLITEYRHDDRIRYPFSP